MKGWILHCTVWCRHLVGCEESKLISLINEQSSLTQQESYANSYAASDTELSSFICSVFIKHYI